MASDYVEKIEGAYRIAGTRVSLDSVAHRFREGSRQRASRSVSPR